MAIRTREKFGDIIFEVADNGCGADLGLLTTRKIVREHGGQVETKPSVDEG